MQTDLASFDGVCVSNDGDYLYIVQESECVRIPYDYVQMFAKGLNKSIDDMDVLNGVI
jgi:hypothetical protein